MHKSLLQIGFWLFWCSVACATVRYVVLNNPSPAPPFTSWATAATNIQAAIEVASTGDEIVVTNGIYATGGSAVHGTMTNRVAVTKPVTLLSVNGPQFTIIQGHQVPGTTNGDGAIRCVYLTNGAMLSGFTLTNGATQTTNDYPMYHQSGGGGIYCEVLQSYPNAPAVVSNCVITSNSAFGPGGGVYGGGVSSAQIIDCELRGNTAAWGGGVADGWVKRCVIADNAAGSGGGAAYYEFFRQCQLEDCVLTGNHAGYGGGAYACYLANCTVAGNSASESGGGLYGFVVIQVQRLYYATNCIVYFNTAASDANFNYGGILANSCTFPDGGGAAIITNAPLFVDLAGGNYHLQANSPCINTGTNAYAPGPVDFDGNPRIVGGTVDMGAYEYQSAQPSLRIVLAGMNILLAWPLWASDYELQQTTVLPPSPTDWSSSGVLPVITNNQNEVLLPIDGESRLYRLFKQE